MNSSEADEAHFRDNIRLLSPSQKSKLLKQLQEMKLDRRQKNAPAVSSSRSE